MNGVTVNVPLDRFKELEQAEETLKKILRGPMFSVVRQNHYQGINFWIHDSDEVNKLLANELFKSEKLAESWRVKNVELEREIGMKSPRGFCR